MKKGTVTKKDDRIILTNFPNFSAQDILECGQVFRYSKNSDGSYTVYSLDKRADVFENGETVEIATCDVDYFYRYFDLDRDYSVIISELSQFPVMQQATTYGKGIRILNQDLYETVISFIVSANNNIKRIQGIIERMCVSLGDKTEKGHYAFPTLAQLQEASIEQLREFGLGYRAEYIYKTAKMLKDFSFEALQDMSPNEARKRLCTLYGVGAKVADCILLFGLHREDVFPCDTWIKKVYHEYFESGHKDNRISDFFVETFGANSGYAQQYLFYFQRKYRQND